MDFVGLGVHFHVGSVGVGSNRGDGGIGGDNQVPQFDEAVPCFDMLGLQVPTQTNLTSYGFSNAYSSN